MIELLYCTTPNCGVCRVAKPQIDAAATTLNATIKHIDLTEGQDRQYVQQRGIDVNGFFSAPILFAVVDGVAQQRPILVGQALPAAEIVRLVNE